MKMSRYATSPETRAKARQKQEQMLTIKEDARRYVKINPFLTDLRKRYMQRRITGQQYISLRGQAINGDLDGAIKGLANVLDANNFERVR